MSEGSDNVLALAGITRIFAQGGTRLEVIHDASFVIDRGEMVALVGPSGSGKSTLLHIAGLLERPSGGTIELAGRPVAGSPVTGMLPLPIRAVVNVSARTWSVVRGSPAVRAVRAAAPRAVSIAAAAGAGRTAQIPAIPSGRTFGWHTRRVPVARTARCSASTGSTTINALARSVRN